MKRITLKYLESISACQEAKAEFADKFPKGATVKVIFDALIPAKLDWANWLIARLLNRKNRIRYAIFAAEQVLEIFEKKYPADKRPRKAIEAAKAVLKKNNKANRDAADAAADAAYAAAYAASKAAYAADAAAYAASKAAYAASKAAYAAFAAANAAANAAFAAFAAAYAAAMKQKIIEHGLKLLKSQ
jgi:hypothetical protein